MKKEVIAYLHTHWDREWYREFEIFRHRLIKVFDNVLNLLETNTIPSFYFDGQVSALCDYLEIRPEKAPLVKQFCEEKKLFIGPFYCLIDEFLTSETVFKKNIELGLKIAKGFGCTDFIGYLADTFGHSKNIPTILKQYNIDKCMVWRGCADEIPAEFIFNGINTINLVRGYFMDIFHANITLSEKVEFLKSNLDKISEKSGSTLLLPIGGDHLNVPENITEQIKLVNQYLDNYEIRLGSPFEYFEKVKGNFNFAYDDELRDNSKTFILQGSYSARMDLKKYNIQCTHKLKLADKAQKHFKLNYDNLIEYAYKLLIQNQAHDGICGCSTDEVHRENICRYKKILQITTAILDEIKYKLGETFLINLSDEEFSGLIEFQSAEKFEDLKVVSKTINFENEILSNTQRVPITGEEKEIFTYQAYIENIKPKELTFFNPVKLPNSNIEISISDKIYFKKADKTYSIEFTDFEDLGDSYNFAPNKDTNGISSKIKDFKQTDKNNYSINLEVNKIELNLEILAYNNFINFKLTFNNEGKNHLLQAKINLLEPIITTFSEDMNTIIERNFDPNYKIREHLPQEKGIEAKTNTAPMQRLVHTQGLTIVTKGLTEYEILENSILITLLRATNIISNPKNPARSTPAGPPLQTTDSQLLGKNIAEFTLCFEEKLNYKKCIQATYPLIIF